MTVEFETYTQEKYAGSDEWAKVDALAMALRDYLDTAPVVLELAKANQPGTSSSEVQRVFEDFAEQLGFESEKRGLFANADLSLRPDYYRPVGNTGILLEVERGKTTINNMDLLDFWKCHLCPHASYLFLMVPKELRQNAKMSPRREFATVRRRLSEFFQPANYTSVRGLCLYGY